MSEVTTVQESSTSHIPNTSTNPTTMEALSLDDYESAEKVAKLGNIDKEFAKLLTIRPPPIPDLHNIKALRESISTAEKRLLDSLPPLPPSIRQIPLTIPFRDGDYSDAILIHPTLEDPTSSGYPLAVLFHGGNWTSSSALHLVPYARGLAELLSIAVLLPSYRLAPEHPFPTAVLDAWDTLRFSAKASNFAPHGIRIDHGRGFILGGYGSGGTIAGVLAQKAKDEALEPALTGQFLGTPQLVSGWCIPEQYRHLWFSPVQNARAPLSPQVQRDISEASLKLDPRSPLASPLNTKDAKAESSGEANISVGASTPMRTFFMVDGEERHSGLPRAFLQTCGMDPARDDGLVYARVLRDSGVDTLVRCYAGLPAMWWEVFPEMDVSRKACGDMARGFAWLLGREKGQWKEEKADEVMALPVSARDNSF